MKIYIKDIHPEGSVIKAALAPKELGLDALEGVRAHNPVEIKGIVQKKGQTVLLEGSIKSVFRFECARCLDLIEKTEEKDFSLDYNINRGTLFIDIDEDIRQEILLNLPERILCKDSCQGLCAYCGVNLNIEKCQCKK